MKHLFAKSNRLFNDKDHPRAILHFSYFSYVLENKGREDVKTSVQ
jgi:hypothetical protein